MKPTMVLDVVGLTRDMLGPDTPHLSALADAGDAKPLRTITPAVTCAVQSSMVTGTLPREHGCVANGWYFRDLASVWLWRQSNALVQGDKIWDLARQRSDRFTVAKMFWWYNMYASVDWAVTPRPIYRANGRKLPDIHSDPPTLRHALQAELGPFPLFDFWGPRAGLPSSQWIATASRRVIEMHDPTLTMVYLPHLDYDLQKFGPGTPQARQAARDIDGVCGELIDFATGRGMQIVVVSEYGITPVRDAVHINRVLREAGHIQFRIEEGEEHLDPGLSEAFAVADHQVAHVYVRDPALVPEIKQLLEGTEGIERVLDEAGKKEVGLDHARSGELVAVSEADRWFSYYWWLDDRVAPDYARTVDIHSKPGYDPCELFVDPDIPLKPVYLGAKLVRSKLLNLRTLLDVIPLDTTLVRGSHGRPTDDPEAGPVVIARGVDVPADPHVTDVRDLVLRAVFD